MYSIEEVQDGDVCLAFGSVYRGGYVVIPRTKICKVLEGMQDGDVCLAFGSVSRGGMLLYPARKYA